MIADLAAQKAIDQLRKHGAATLSDIDVTVAAVWLFCSGVANSGFERYYSGWRGDLAHRAPEALRAIGAVTLAEIATAANAVFGPEGPPRERAERLARVRALPERVLETFEALENRYYACDEEVDARLERYLADATGRPAEHAAH